MKINHKTNIFIARAVGTTAAGSRKEKGAALIS
jgi:hypothetical protein